MSDYRTTTGTPLPKNKTERRDRLWQAGIIGGVAFVALLAAGALIHVDRYTLCSGYVTTEAHAEVRSPTVGLVTGIVAVTGDEVNSGDVLACLDDAQERAALREQQERLRKTEAELARLRMEISEKKRLLSEGIAIAELRLQDAGARLQRVKELLDNGLVAASAMDDARLRENLARAELSSLAKSDQSLFDRQLDVLQQELKAQEALAAGTEARIRLKAVTAPIPGRVVRYEFVVGELVTPDTVLYEVFGNDNPILKLRIPERHATRVAPGNRYRARLGSYRGLRKIWFEGTVTALRDIIQGEGDQRYRMAYATFEAGARQAPPGTAAEARVYYGKSSLWSCLFGLD